MRESITDKELFSSGHMACPGCGLPLALRYALKALGERTILIIPAGCAAVIDGIYPYTASRIPLLHIPFEITASAAAGVRAGLRHLGINDVVVLGWAGDGATYDIGFQALSSVAERNEDIIFICYDNEAYMNTGIQRSSATPIKAWTATTPLTSPKKEYKKNIVEIMAAHEIPLAASASIAYPEDFMQKLSKAKTIEGTKFINVFSPCPTGWRYQPELTVMLARLAVETRIFPLYQVEYGRKYIVKKDFKPKALKEYLKIQGRFRHLKEDDYQFLQERVEKEWNRLLAKERLSF